MGARAPATDCAARLRRWTRADTYRWARVRPAAVAGRIELERTGETHVAGRAGTVPGRRSFGPASGGALGSDSTTGGRRPRQLSRVVRVLAVVVDVRVQLLAVEDVIEVAHQHVVDQIADAVSEAGGGRTEHMFVGYVRGRTDSPISCNFSCSYPKSSRETRNKQGKAADAAQPRADQTSSLVRIRSTTAVVNSVVPAEPPRSNVLTPEATVSSAAS